MVRQLSLKNSLEWNALGTAGRPPGVPAHPYEVYPSEFRGIGDWLGRPIRPSPTCSQVDSTGATTTPVTNTANICNVGVQQLMARLESDFVFFQMPRFAQFNLLYQPKNTADPSLWGALLVRTSNSAAARTGAPALFVGPAARQGRPHAYVYFDNVNDDFFILEDAAAKSLSLSRGRGAKYDRFYTEPDAIPHVLADFLSRRTRRTKLQWISDSVTARRDRIRTQAIIGMWDSVFAPTGIDVQFPGELAHHNMELNRKKIVYRVCATPKRGKPGWPYKVSLLKTLATNCNDPIPLHVDDDFDFLSVFLVDSAIDTLLGCFLVPKHVLAERGVLGSSAYVGMETLTLYPPGLTTKLVPLGRVGQEWQSQFYVDLRNSSCLGAGRERFMQILHNSSSG